MQVMSAPVESPNIHCSRHWTIQECTEEKAIIQGSAKYPADAVGTLQSKLLLTSSPASHTLPESLAA